MTNWWAALNFILIDLAENQSYCLYNYRGSPKILVALATRKAQFRTLYMHSDCLPYMHSDWLLYMHSDWLLYMHSDWLLYMHSDWLLYMHFDWLLYMHSD